MRLSEEEDEKPKRRSPPATTPEGREKQLIAYAYDLAEKHLLDGTASSQEITFFLKRASAKENIEQDILLSQKKLIEAKTEALQSSKKIEELYKNAIVAMRTYTGQGSGDDDEE